MLKKDINPQTFFICLSLIFLIFCYSFIVYIISPYLDKKDAIKKDLEAQIFKKRKEKKELNDYYSNLKQDHYFLDRVRRDKLKESSPNDHIILFEDDKILEKKLLNSKKD